MTYKEISNDKITKEEKQTIKMELTFHSEGKFGTIKIGDKEYNLRTYLPNKKYKYWLDSWSNKKIYENKNIKELLIYKNQTLWYLIEWFIFRSCSYSRNSGIFYILSIIDILDKNITEDIEARIYDIKNPIFVNILKDICKKKKVKLKIIEKKEIKNFKDIIRRNNFFIAVGINSLFLLDWLFSKLRILIKDRKKSDVIILSSIRFSRKKDVNNVLFGSIIKKLQENKVTYKLIHYSSKPVVESLKTVIKDFLFKKNKLFKDYCSLTMIFSNIRKKRYFKKIWSKLRRSKQFKNSLEYKGINIYSYIVPAFELVFNAYIYMVLKNLSVTKRIIKKEKPKIILIDQEYNFYGKGFMINSKNKDFPKIISLQHELVYPGCIHTHIKNKEVLSKKGFVWRPLPYKKICGGEYAKNVLIETCNYPKDTIAVTGNPKFDALVNIKFDKNETLKKYKLSKNKKRILFASQNNPGMYPFILKLSKKIPNSEIIIKPNPHEDIQRVNDYFKNKGDNIKILNNRANLYRVLSVSDIVLTFVSTVALESMVKQVPVIILNPLEITKSSEISGLPYIKEKAALEANSVEELYEKIKELDDISKRKKLLKNSYNFVLKQNYKNDGKASDRVVSEIKKIIKN